MDTPSDTPNSPTKTVCTESNNTSTTKYLHDTGQSKGNTSDKKKNDSGNKLKSKTNSRRGKKNLSSRGGHTRAGQHRRQQNKKDSVYKNSHGEDLDVSIQEELLGGNFKMKGRKAQMSINHLLDFSLPEVEREKIPNQRRNLRRKKEYEEEHINLTGDSFINVNYRLLVKENEDYSEQINNPNSVISDDKIIAVVVPKGQSCPICLCEEPIAPRMVGCGHIFCCTCLINFFSVEEKIKDKNSGYVKKKKYKECPLCNNIVRPQRVKQVVYLENSDVYLKDQILPKLGKNITLDLMFLPHGSSLSIPVKCDSNLSKIDGIPNINNIPEAKYSRIVKCDASYALKLLNEDIESIKTQNEIDQALYNDDNKFTKLAFDQIDNTIISILSENEESITSGIRNISLSQNKNSQSSGLAISDDNGYFFYQTYHNSSTKFFLSPLDVKILVTIFEKYSMFPPELSIEIENIHYDTIVTENLIRRYKYMSNLPLGTEIAFIDINWKEIPFLEHDVHEQFKTELKQRRRELNMKKQREDRNKKMYEAKLEEDTAAFYRAENGESYSTFEQSEDYKLLSHSDAMLDTLWSIKDKQNMNGPIVDNHGLNELPKRKGYKETTIWGTSISVIPDEKTSRENDEFAAMLMKKMHTNNGTGNEDELEVSTLVNTSSSSTDLGLPFSQSDSSLPRKGAKKGKKKKGKVILFST